MNPGRWLVKSFAWMGDWFWAMAESLPLWSVPALGCRAPPLGLPRACGWAGVGGCAAAQLGLEAGSTLACRFMQGWLNRQLSWP